VAVSTVDLISQAIEEYKPRSVFAMFSGGNDSVCSTFLASQHVEFTAAVLVDTGIAIKQAHEHARITCETMGWPLLVYKSPFKYDDLVMQYGFPGPSQHRVMYIQLKERAIDALVRDHKQKRTDKIILITGVRKQESTRRMETVTGPIVKHKAKIWIAPMWDWDNDRRDQFIQDNNLPRNPIKPLIHVSGDCLCGAFAGKGELELLHIFFPEEYRRIKVLQDKVMQKFPWSYDEMPPKWWKDYGNGQRFLGQDFMPLCWSCDRRIGESNENQ
jgi:3'-phosphoadenosine 5'-phosphosulfate sulfotransferase (PAPS reductase)/FAD synthetase